MSWERGVVIKTAEEIEIMRAAGRINALALDTVRNMAQPGVTTAQLDAAAEEVKRGDELAALKSEEKSEITEPSPEDEASDTDEEDKEKSDTDTDSSDKESGAEKSSPEQEDGEEKKHPSQMVPLAALHQERDRRKAAVLEARDYKKSIDDLKKQMEELKAQIERLGEVNLAAAQEEEELTQRHQFLSDQRDDLLQSLESLNQAIRKINRTTRQRFVETFHTINAKFQTVFPELFQGGRAELKLTDEENILETGIDIVAQPPGKRLQSIDLLSGGEKTLTAVALLISIFLVKPSPFCLLDEADSALDDLNATRFNNYMQKISHTSQFIMITHNKLTMQAAHTLYGITMQEPGISKVVSVKLQ